ncbi:hypothetical protein Pla100_35330 [Neorhodopirellula pilleata]|uniref:Uncharacterized protein n=1 Tax=Neorhodopirellula pilleata TaxID=2714738 RepID=A0A5C6A4W1_9BACT|nr:hypothetical protein Pla100_35330 [Neorhodopirellula pilleata]
MELISGWVGFIGEPSALRWFGHSIIQRRATSSSLQSGEPTGGGPPMGLPHRSHRLPARTKPTP